MLGVALAQQPGNVRRWARRAAALGRALVLGMPGFLTLLSAAGTAAMIWVGGGIIVHGLEVYGLHAIGALIHHIAQAAAHALPAVAGAIEWIVAAAGAGIFGLAIGAVLIPVMEFAVAPTWRRLKSALRGRERVA